MGHGRAGSAACPNQPCRTQYGSKKTEPLFFKDCASQTRWMSNRLGPLIMVSGGGVGITMVFWTL